jgi:hypothetical protein
MGTRKTPVHDSTATTYVETGGDTLYRGDVEFVMDARKQEKIVPKAAPRAAESFGFKTMNEGGRPAGKVYGKL